MDSGWWSAIAAGRAAVSPAKFRLGVRVSFTELLRGEVLVGCGAAGAVFPARRRGFTLLILWQWCALLGASTELTGFILLSSPAADIFVR